MTSLLTVCSIATPLSAAPTPQPRSSMFYTVTFLRAVTILAVRLGFASASVIHESPGTLAKRIITPNSEGYHNGYFYKWWSDGGAPNAEYKNLAAGGYE